MLSDYELLSLETYVTEAEDAGPDDEFVKRFNPAVFKNKTKEIKNQDKQLYKRLLMLLYRLKDINEAKGSTAQKDDRATPITEAAKRAGEAALVRARPAPRPAQTVARAAPRPAKTVARPAPATPKAVVWPRKTGPAGFAQNRKAGAGLVNEGNTCYLNATMQALAFPKMINAVRSLTVQFNRNVKNKLCEEFITNFYRLIQELSEAQGGVRKATACRTKFSDILKSRRSVSAGTELNFKNFKLGRQNDAAEFIKVLFEELFICAGEQRKPVSPRFIGADNIDTIVNDYSNNLLSKSNEVERALFLINLKEGVYGDSVPATYTIEIERDFIIEFSYDQTLQQLMQNHYNPAIFEENIGIPGRLNSYQYYIWRLPDILMIQIRRNTFGEVDQRPLLFDPNEDLNMGFFLHPLSPEIGKTSTYSLQSAIVHVGASPDSGHYTSWVRKPQGWVYFDDAKEPARYGYDVPDLFRTHAGGIVVLFYVRNPF